MGHALNKFTQLMVSVHIIISIMTMIPMIVWNIFSKVRNIVIGIIIIRMSA